MRTSIPSSVSGYDHMFNNGVGNVSRRLPGCCYCHCSTGPSKPVVARASWRRQQCKSMDGLHSTRALTWRSGIHTDLRSLVSTCSVQNLTECQNGSSNSVSAAKLTDLRKSPFAFDTIESALQDIALGKFVVALDDEDRENEGDLIAAADLVTTESMAFMVEYTSGVVCIGMEGADLDRLRLPLMVNSAENEEALRTAFTVTVDLKEGVTTGISAADRALTLRALANPATQAEHLRRPGHIFPLRCREGGVLTRPGHTEAAVDLARLAGRFPAGVLCEIVNKKDGSMARTPDLLKFAREHDLKCITIADLILYRLNHTPLTQP